MSIATILPAVFPQFRDPTTDTPLAGGKVYFFEAGTSTPQNVYEDSTLTTPWSNPVILNSAGYFTGPVYLLTSPAYKVRVDDANDVTVDGPWDAIIASAPSA